jgi:ribose transport system permease protein
MKLAKQLLPLLIAVVVLQCVFRFGIPFLWDGIPDFWGVDNQVNLAQQISINAILAFGMTLTILIGGIDLSVGYVLTLAGTTTVFLLCLGEPESQSALRLLLAISGGLGVAALFGAMNGLFAAKTKMPPFIITLATMLVARGASLMFNEGRPMRIPAHQTAFLALGNERVPGLDIPYPVIVMGVIFAISAILLHRTRFGQHLYAIGGNRQAAHYTGIPVARREVAVYVICALFVGVASMIHTPQLYSARPDSGRGYELNAIAAAVVGGTSFSGGVGTMAGTLLGAIIIGIVNKGLNQAEVHHSWQEIIKGLVILAAVYIDTRRRK